MTRELTVDEIKDIEAVVRKATDGEYIPQSIKLDDGFVKVTVTAGDDAALAALEALRAANINAVDDGDLTTKDVGWSGAAGSGHCEVYIKLTDADGPIFATSS